MKKIKLIILAASIQAVLGLTSPHTAFAVTPEEEASELERQKNEATQIEERKKELVKEQDKNYYQKTRGYRSEPEPDVPRYVRTLSNTQFEQFKDITWLDVGLDFRTRYEYRENDYRRIDTADKPVYRKDPDNLFLLRTRAYLGVKEILDPFRFVVEFQDSRSYNSLYEKTSADVDEFDLLQLYGELYFEDLLGVNRPLTIRVGRQSLELLDRRLLGNNQFRNTANNHEGFRILFGKKENNWDLDTFAFHPVERLKYDIDRGDEDTWFYGAVFSWREWSKYITIQPYFLGKKVNGDPYNKVKENQKNDMDIYAPGLRIYGLIGDTGFDFDADVNKQFGRFGYTTKNAKGKPQQVMLQHDAIGYTIELGYTFKHDWKPRASVLYAYGSGDNILNNNVVTDGKNQRFDTFYGFNQPWSRNDYFAWDNVHAPKARIELAPFKNFKMDAGYGAYWLANDTAPWARTKLQDTTGKSGSFLGHEFDIRFVHQINPYVDWSLSYARFEPGSFTRAQDNSLKGGPYTSQPSNFFYFEVSLNPLLNVK